MFLYLLASNILNGSQTKSKESINSKTRKTSSISKLSKSLSRMSIFSTRSVNTMRIYHWFLEPQFYVIACIYMSARLFVNISQSYITFYVQYTVVLSADMIAIIPLIMYVAGFSISLVLKFVTDRFGYKIAFVLSCFVGIGKIFSDQLQ